MSDRFVIEVDRAVVGVAVRGPGGFRFFASSPDFKALEDRTFPRARAMVRAAELAKRRRRRSRGRPVEVSR